VHETGADALVYRVAANSEKSAVVYDRLRAETPSEFEEILPEELESTKSAALQVLNSYQPPADIYYKRPRDGFVYCWNEQELKASVLTNPELGTSAFMAFTGSYAQDEIELRKREVSTYQQITEADWISRKNQILSILNSL
jgi:hypothetical protein